MNDLSYNKWDLKSDTNIEQDLGKFIKDARLQQNKTQSEVAKEADISRSTLSLLERGEAGTVNTFIKVLRVLNQLNLLEIFEVKTQISPLALTKLEQGKKKRASRKMNDATNKVEW